MDTQEVSAAPIASKTSTTEGCFPSSDPKSWPKPAIPIESSLKSRVCSVRLKVCRLRLRNMVHPRRTEVRVGFVTV
jgi:hypothetical protein